MLSIQVINMETIPLNSIESYRYHIHNYTPLAVKSFIYEIEKYPIIFSGKNVLNLKKELIEFAWTRITIALLDTVVPVHHKVGLVNMEYWNQSFRQLWKWMLDIYMKDQAENRKKDPKIYIVRSVKYQWLDFMSFLDPYTYNSNNTSNSSDVETPYNSNIRLKVLPASTKVIHLEAGNHIVLWLRKFSESVNANNLCISVCLEIQRCFSPPLPLGLETMFKQDADIDESQLVKYIGHPYTKPVHLKQQIRITPVIKKKPTEEVNKKLLPRAVSFETIIDKDYKYIMSLYPKLSPLEKNRKFKVKKLMILALMDSL